jgi:hypothetical protein
MSRCGCLSPRSAGSWRTGNEFAENQPAGNCLDISVRILAGSVTVLFYREGREQ